jgi:hypothetical protein
MPFTPSHAVVALPFIRTPLMPGAIAVGAMTPDLPLFLRGFGVEYGKTHDLAWLPATVVVALALLLVWRCLLRPATRELSPTWLARRFPVSWDRGAGNALRDTFSIAAEAGKVGARRWHVSWAGVLLLVASLAIGVVTHIVWDLFTHEGRAGVSAIPALDEQWGPLLGYKWLQYGSSAAGLVILAVWAWWWLSKRRAAASIVRVLPSWVRWVWWLSLPAALVIGWVYGLAVYGPLDDEFTFQHLAYRVLPPACAVWAAVTLVLCVAVQAVRTARAGRTAAA